MAVLNSTYQYIGRSNGVKAYGKSFYFYILLYAKTDGSPDTGKHNVSVKMRLACTIDSTFYDYNTTGYAKINGVDAFTWKLKQIPGDKWPEGTLTEGGVTYGRYTDLMEGSVEVDTQYAQKDITISASWIRNAIEVTPPNWLPKNEYATANITVTLPTIPSASIITSVADATLGNKCSVKWTPKSAAYRYKLKFSVGNWNESTGIIHPDKNTEYVYSDYTIPIEAANQIKTKTGIMTVTLYTYSDSGATSQIGSEDTEIFTVTVPENEATKPKVSMSLSPVSTLEAPFNSLYVQGKSKVKATLEWSLKYGADVEDSNITVDGAVYGDPYESECLTKVGVFSVTGFVKDSRGHDNKESKEITVIPYSKPVLQAASGESNIVAVRCDTNGHIKDSGTCLKIKAKIIYEKVISDGEQKNFGKIQYRYRAEGGAWPEKWETILDTASAAGTEIDTGPLLDGVLYVRTNYQVQVRAVDDLEEAQPITLSVPSDDVYMDRPAGGKSMGLGGYAQGNGNLDIYWKTKARGGLSLFNEEGEEISADNTLPLPRGQLGEGWDPDNIENGVYEVSAYPFKDLMENGVLIQMTATVDGAVKIQMAFPSGTHTPVYRIKWGSSWTDWNTFKI